MKPYDLDESGNIDLPEFMAFLSHQYGEAKGRIDDLMHQRVMYLIRSIPCSSATGATSTSPTTDGPYSPMKAVSNHSGRRANRLSQIIQVEKNQSHKSKSQFVTDNPEGIQYVPPRQGILHVKLIDGFYKKDFYSTVRTFDHYYAKEVANTLDSGMSMMEYAIKNSKLRLSEAVALYYR